MKDYNGNEWVCPSCGSKEQFSATFREEARVERYYEYGCVDGIDSDGYVDSVCDGDCMDEEYIEGYGQEINEIECDSCNYTFSGFMSLEEWQEENGEGEYEVEREPAVVSSASGLPLTHEATARLKALGL